MKWVANIIACKSEIIHHNNKKPWDDRIENLDASKWEHKSLHKKDCGGRANQCILFRGSVPVPISGTARCKTLKTFWRHRQRGTDLWSSNLLKELSELFGRNNENDTSLYLQHVMKLQNYQDLCNPGSDGYICPHTLKNNF
jgi:hypothetical protein